MINRLFYISTCTCDESVISFVTSEISCSRFLQKKKTFKSRLPDKKKADAVGCKYLNNLAH